MRIAVLIISLCFSITTFAQDYDFGKVSKEELQEKFNPLDSSANATYLYKYRRTYFKYSQGIGFQLFTDIHQRIKVYKKEGFENATHKVLLFNRGGDKEKVSSLKAYTYNLESGKINDTKLQKDGIFDTEYDDHRDLFKFTMPNLKEGSVVEFRYTIISDFFWNVDDFVFQHDIPVKKIEAKFEAPEYYNFKVNTIGFLHTNPETERRPDKITFQSKERNGFKGTTFSSSDLKFSKYVTSYNLNNIPALKDEPYVNNINNYRSAVKYELSYTKMPQSSPEYYSTTWEDVVKKIYESSNFGGELDKNGYYEDDIDVLISSDSDPQKRVNLIFNFVKARVNWNGNYGKYCADGVKKAYKDKVGNVAEINLMLTSMLQHAGLNAYPVLISTRDNGVPIFPTREGYNYVVSYVKFTDGSAVLLDATNKYAEPNIVPFRVLNWQGRVIAEHGGSELIDLYPKAPSENSIALMGNLDEEGNLKGQYRSMKTGHNALSFREGYVEANKDEFLEKLENKYNGIEISEYSVKNELDLSEPVVESYEFFKESQADIIGEKMYFSPMFFLKTSETPFKLEKREFPVDFGYPSNSIYRIMIKIPEGYQIESVPEPMVLALPDNLGEFKFNISGNGNSIQAIISTKINEAIISPLYYDALKEYFNRFIEKEAEQVVLTKG